MKQQVVIVGGGPVGVGLAVEMGQRGIRCVLLERRVEPQRIPKGQNLTPRTLEHFHFWGCVDELRAAHVADYQKFFHRVLQNMVGCVRFKRTKSKAHDETLCPN